MTSACIFKDTLRNHTQVFLEFRNSIWRFVYISSTPTALSTSYLFIDVEQRRGNIKGNPASRKWMTIISYTDHSTNLHQLKSVALIFIFSSSFDMSSNILLDSADSDIFYVEQLSNEPSPRRNNTPNILNSTELSEHHAARMPSVSSIASPQPQIVTISDDSNEPTTPYGFGRQLPIVPPSLNDLNFPPNPFNILATMAVVDYTEDEDNDGYSPGSPDPSDPSPISAPPMNVSTFNSWETTQTTTDDNTFYSDDEPRRIYFLPSTPTPSPPPRKLKRKLSLGMSFPKEGGVSQHICEACGQTIPSVKDTPGPSNRD